MVAKQEFDLLGMDLDGDERDRVLRKPQLNKLEAARDMAEAQLEQAALDRRRTEIRAPFNAVIRERFVNLGAQVSSATRFPVGQPVRSIPFSTRASAYASSDPAWSPSTASSASPAYRSSIRSSQPSIRSPSLTMMLSFRDSRMRVQR